jgi:glycosyltransferase involved in cell wall biosynthesis
MKIAFLLISDGPFGGAQRRFLTLFFHLKHNSGITPYFFVSHSLRNQIKDIFPSEDLSSIIPVGPHHKLVSSTTTANGEKKEQRSLKIRLLLKSTVFYKYYYFLNNYIYQRKLYNEIESFRIRYEIKVFLGVYSGILPLYFYLSKKNRPGIIFTNMDSWFSNISGNPEREWYRKYSTFNFGMENSDIVDFLSPFIYEGVKKLGVRPKEEKVFITPCSFSDYSKCKTGGKEKFAIAFSARLEKDKNPVLFTEAAIKLAEDHPEVDFHIMGEGRLSGNIRSMVSESGFSNIIFHGFHPNPVKVMAETKVFVSLQTTNNYPSQSVLEAMACGNAIIATDVGDTRMFLDESKGSLISLDKQSLIKCLSYYIYNPAIAEKKGNEASEFVRTNHTIERASEYYSDLFRRCLKQ